MYKENIASNERMLIFYGKCRNVLKATIDVPRVGELNFYCTHLDHLDENWRMKQINAIIQSSDKPHILAGGLNSLDETDYSTERWTEIVKVHTKNHIYIYISKSQKMKSNYIVFASFLI